MVLACLGLGAVIATSSVVFTALKVFGVVYLVYLGIRTFRAPAPDFAAVTSVTSAGRRPGWFYRQGFAVAATNPKALAFYAAFFPQFIDPSGSIVTQFALLAGTCVVVDYVGVVAYAFLAEHGGRTLWHSGRLAWVNRIAGAALIAAAGLLAMLQPERMSTSR